MNRRGSADIVKVDICATKLCQKKVSDRVGALNIIPVVLIRLHEPRVSGHQKVSYGLSGPELFHMVRKRPKRSIKVGSVLCTRSQDGDRYTSGEMPPSVEGA